jgi:hypothetical protein
MAIGTRVPRYKHGLRKPKGTTQATRNGWRSTTHSPRPPKKEKKNTMLAGGIVEFGERTPKHGKSAI